MTTYFEAPDGLGESTLWVWAAEGNRHAVSVMRQSDVTPGFWPDVVARMTGTTITTDDATVQLVARTISEHGGDIDSSIHSWRCAYPDRYGKCDCIKQAARAILAALTGVPHD